MGSSVTEVQENRNKVISYLRSNPENFAKIELFPKQGNGRCLIGMVCEALNFPLADYVEGNDDAYAFAENSTQTSCVALWGLNDGNTEATWEDLANALEAAWQEPIWVQTLDMPLS